MAVYVDSARNQFGRMKMRLMIADTQAELHTMAERIGMRREWFQEPPHAAHRGPADDVSLSKRSVAVEYGAVEVDRAPESPLKSVRALSSISNAILTG
jgi:hypothetical protein